MRLADLSASSPRGLGPFRDMYGTSIVAAEMLRRTSPDIGQHNYDTYMYI